MRATQLSQFLTFAINAKLPVLVKGKPGIGKSDIIETATADAGADLILSHPVVSDPTDYKGLPYAANGKASFLPFGDLQRLIDARKPTVFFLDDLGQASPAVQASCMQLILARRINGFAVSEHVTFFAATNRKEDKAAVSGLLEPVKSRFASILELEVDHNDWCNWALTKGGMPVELVAFIRYRPELLDNFTPTKDIVNSPSPRTVAYVGKLLAAGLPEAMWFEAFKGAAGEGFATEFLSFLKMYKDLPNIDQIFMNPMLADVPTQPGILYAVSAAIAKRITDVNAGNAFTYLERLPLEISMACVKDITTSKPEILTTMACTKWLVKNGNGIFS